MSMKRKLRCGVTFCYGCLCNTCANSVELPSWYVTIGEAEEPCFSCDECRHYDGDFSKRSMWTEICPRYVEAKKVVIAKEERRRAAENKRAEILRATFKVINGRKGNEQKTEM